MSIADGCHALDPVTTSGAGHIAVSVPASDSLLQAGGYRDRVTISLTPSAWRGRRELRILQMRGWADAFAVMTRPTMQYVGRTTGTREGTHKGSKCHPTDASQASWRKAVPPSPCAIVLGYSPKRYAGQWSEPQHQSCNWKCCISTKRSTMTDYRSAGGGRNDRVGRIAGDALMSAIGRERTIGLLLFNRNYGRLSSSARNDHIWPLPDIDGC